MDARRSANGLQMTWSDTTMVAAETILPAHAAVSFAFRILSHGRVLDEYDVVREKRMHLILVRRDLAVFQHVHPESVNGTWAAEVGPLLPGSWRAFADFSTGGTPMTLGVDFHVPGVFDPLPLATPQRSRSTDGLTITLAATAEEVAFAVTRDGHAVALEPYLGAAGHLVTIREGDLAFVHADPIGSELRFRTMYPTPGRYRLFLRFAVDGVVHTTAFTVWIGRASRPAQQAPAHGG